MNKSILLLHCMSFDLNVIAAFIIGSTITYMATEPTQIPIREPPNVRPIETITLPRPFTRKNIVPKLPKAPTLFSRKQTQASVGTRQNIVSSTPSVPSKPTPSVPSKPPPSVPSKPTPSVPSKPTPLVPSKPTPLVPSKPKQILADVILNPVTQDTVTRQFNDYYNQGHIIDINQGQSINRCLICSLAVILQKNKTDFYQTLIDKYTKHVSKVNIESIDMDNFKNQFLPKTDGTDVLIEVPDFMSIFNLCLKTGIVFFHPVVRNTFNRLTFPTEASQLPGYYVRPLLEDTPYIFNIGDHFVVGKGKLPKHIIDYVRTYYTPIDDAPIKIDC